MVAFDHMRLHESMPMAALFTFPEFRTPGIAEALHVVDRLPRTLLPAEVSNPTPQLRMYTSPETGSPRNSRCRKPA